MANSKNNSPKDPTSQHRPPKKTAHIHNNYESFYTLFHANPIPTLLTRLEDNVVMNANQALLDYLNLPHDAVIGHTAQEFNLGLNLQSQQRAVLTTQLLKDGNIRNFEEEIELPSGKCKTVLTSSTERTGNRISPIFGISKLTDLEI